MDLDQLYFEKGLERRKIARNKLTQDVEAILGKCPTSGPIEDPEQKLFGFPDYAFQRLRNNEIWDQVLPYITDPVDVKNLYCACPSFQLQPDLRERRLTDLYSSVLVGNLLKGKYLQSNYYYYYEDRFGPKRSAILTTRLISKRAKRVIEWKYFEELLTAKDWHVQSGIGSGTDNLKLNLCRFQGINQVEEAISVLANVESGHCFIRCLYIEDNGDGLDYVNRIMDFLDIHGYAVWGLVYQSEIFTEENYEVLHDIVCRTPNLKALRLNMTTTSIVYEDHPALQELVRIHPFPQIPFLKFLDFTINFCPFFMAHVLQRNDHIKTFQLLKTLRRHQFPREDFSILERGGGLENLKLEFYTGPYYPYGALSQTEWPLKVLQLYSAFDGHSRFRDNDLFPTLNRFASTLEELALKNDIEKAEDQDGLSKTKLDLPRLKRLALLGDQKDRNGRYWFDWDYNERGVPCISLGDLVGLTAIEELRFSRPVYYIENYFKAFPCLKLIQNGWREEDMENGKVFRRNHPQIKEYRPAPKPKLLTMSYAEAVKKKHGNRNSSK